MWQPVGGTTWVLSPLQKHLLSSIFGMLVFLCGPRGSFHHLTLAFAALQPSVVNPVTSASLRSSPSPPLPVSVLALTNRQQTSFRYLGALIESG